MVITPDCPLACICARNIYTSSAARSGDLWLGVVITKWTKATKPIGAKGCVIGFVAISWHGLVIEGFQVNSSPTGLFLEFPRHRTASGRWLRIVRFRTVAEQQFFRTEVLAALMKAYPEDFIGRKAAMPPMRQRRSARAA